MAARGAAWLRLGGALAVAHARLRSSRPQPWVQLALAEVVAALHLLGDPARDAPASYAGPCSPSSVAAVVGFAGRRCWRMSGWSAHQCAVMRHTSALLSVLGKEVMRRVGSALGRGLPAAPARINEVSALLMRLALRPPSLEAWPPFQVVEELEQKHAVEILQRWWRLNRAGRFSRASVFEQFSVDSSFVGDEVSETFPSAADYALLLNPAKVAKRIVKDVCMKSVCDSIARSQQDAFPLENLRVGDPWENRLICMRFRGNGHYEPWPWDRPKILRQ